MINIYLRRSHATKTFSFFFCQSAPKGRRQNDQRQIRPSITPPLPSDVP